MIPSCSAFSFGATFIARFEAAGVGAQWSNLDTHLMGMNGSLMWCGIMILIDSVAYFIIGWYFRNIFPGEHLRNTPTLVVYTLSF